jgi:hypothetical protein
MSASAQMDTGMHACLATGYPWSGILVIFFITIHKMVGIVVLIVLIAVGLLEVVYLVLRLCMCRPPLPLSYFTTRRGRDGAIRSTAL